DAGAARFSAIVGQVQAQRWAAGAFEPVVDGKHRIAVSYPDELLDKLRDWARENARPRHRGRKPHAKLVDVCTRMDELEAAGMQWKGISRAIRNDFGIHLKPDSARRKWWRWKHAEKICGT